MFGWLSASRLENENFQNDSFFYHEDQSGGIVIHWDGNNTVDYVVGKRDDLAVLYDPTPSTPPTPPSPISITFTVVLVNA